MKLLLNVSGILLVLLTVSCNKNDPKPDDSGLFIKFFGTSVNSAGYALAETSDGFVLVGSSIVDKDSRTDTDILVIKTDLNGNRKWEKRIGGLKNDLAREVKLDDSGNIYLLGSKAQLNSDSMDIYLVKLNTGGEVLEEKTFGSDSTSEEGYSLSFLSSTAMLIAGTITKGNDRDMYVLKTNGATIEWERKVGVLNENDDLNKVIQVGDGRFMWCGTAERSTTESNARVALSDADGLLQWQYEFGQFNNNQEFGRDILNTDDGNFLVVGSRGSTGSSNESLWLLKVDIYGDLLWDKQPAGSPSAGYSISKCSDGSYVAAGYRNIGIDNNDFLLLKLNKDGDSEWSKIYGGNGNDVTRKILQSSDGGFVMLGQADLFDNRNGVFALIKTDAEGNLNPKNK